MKPIFRKNKINRSTLMRIRRLDSPLGEPGLRLTDIIEPKVVWVAAPNRDTAEAWAKTRTDDDRVYLYIHAAHRLYGVTRRSRFVALDGWERHHDYEMIRAMLVQREFVLVNL